MSKHISLKAAKLINSHRYILKKLARSNIKDRKKILSNAPNDLFKVLLLIFKLLENNKLNLDEKHETKIRPHKKLIRSTSELNRHSIKGKLTRQRGGALPAILSTILPILGAVVKAVL